MLFVETTTGSTLVPTTTTTTTGATKRFVFVDPFEDGCVAVTSMEIDAKHDTGSTRTKQRRSPFDIFRIVQPFSITTLASLQKTTFHSNLPLMMAHYYEADLPQPQHSDPHLFNNPHHDNNNNGTQN